MFWKLRCLVALLFSTIGLLIGFGGGIVLFVWLAFYLPEVFVTIGKNPIVVFGFLGIFICAGVIIHIVGRLITQVGYDLFSFRRPM